MAVNIPSGRSDELPIIFVDFNQDLTSLCVGTRSGYSLLSTTGDHVTETFAVNSDPMCLVGRLFTSSLVTLVSLNNMRKLLVFHYRRNTLICEYQYSRTILAVKMNRQRLVVCVEDGIFIHNIRDMEMLHKIEETPPNRNGVISLSSSPDKGYLAYPGSHRVGTVFIFDALNFSNVTSIAAHDGLLASMTFNSSSTMLATASERGTVVRVFSIPLGDKLMEFRRGLARCASICCLSFSLDNHFLVAASNTETVHVFKLDTITPRPDGMVGGDGTLTRNFPVDFDADVESTDPNIPGRHLDSTVPGSGDLSSGWSGGLMHWVGDALKATAAYLPHQVSEVFSQDRAFAFARIPLSCYASISTAGGFQETQYVTGDATSNFVGLKKVAALISVQNKYRLVVASLDGQLHTYSFNHVQGGEAVLLFSQNLLAPDPVASSPESGLCVKTHERRQCGPELELNAQSPCAEESSPKRIGSTGQKKHDEKIGTVKPPR